MHIYPCRLTPSHLSIDALNTTTPILVHLMAEQCTYTHGRWSPHAIKHRCLEYHYTKLGTSNGRTMHIYLWQMDPQSIKHRSLEYCYTKCGRCINIYRTIYTHGRLIPSSQVSIDPWNTSTPNLAHLMAEQCTYTHGK